jgi:hypothetical protein
VVITLGRSLRPRGDERGERSGPSPLRAHIEAPLPWPDPPEAPPPPRPKSPREGGPYREPEPTIDARELAELRAEVDTLEKRLRRTQRLLRRARWWAQIAFVLAAASWVTEAAILVAVRGWL